MYGEDIDTDTDVEGSDTATVTKVTMSSDTMHCECDLAENDDKSETPVDTNCTLVSGTISNIATRRKKHATLDYTTSLFLA